MERDDGMMTHEVTQEKPAWRIAFSDSLFVTIEQFVMGGECEENCWASFF